MTKQTLSIEQMQHLQELGLDTNNASASWYKPDMDTEYMLMFGHMKKEELVGNEESIPAYTLQDVLDVFPKYYHIANIGWTKLSIRVHTTKEWEIGYVYTDELSKYAYGCRKTEKNLIDAAYELLVWCIDNKFVETNKNE